jgi:hypothetical protein
MPMAGPQARPIAAPRGTAIRYDVFGLSRPNQEILSEIKGIAACTDVASGLDHHHVETTAGQTE